MIILSPLCYVIEPTGRFRNEMEKESGIAERMLRRRQNNKNPAFFPRFALKAAKPSDSRGCVKIRIMDEKSLPVVPSSWEEGLGVVEKNNDITYYKSYVYEMVEPFLSLPPLTPPSRRRGLQNDSLLYYDTPSLNLPFSPIMGVFKPCIIAAPYQGALNLPFQNYTYIFTPFFPPTSLS